MNHRPRLDETSAQLVTAAADSAVSDPDWRWWVARWFESWLERRAVVAHLPAGAAERYLLAKSALWHDHVTEEDGHGVHQVIGTTDCMVLELIAYAKRMQGAAGRNQVENAAVVDRTSNRSPRRESAAGLEPRAQPPQPSGNGEARRGRLIQQLRRSKASKHAPDRWGAE